MKLLRLYKNSQKSDMKYANQELYKYGLSSSLLRILWNVLILGAAYASAGRLFHKWLVIREKEFFHHFNLKRNYFIPEPRKLYNEIIAF